MKPYDSPMQESPRSDSIGSLKTQLDTSAGRNREFAGGNARAHTPPPIPDHELLRVIGQGAYGEVWLARNIMGTHRAVKVVYRDSFDSDRPFEREFSGIQSFEPISRSHESQVDILHVGRNEALGSFYYVMELADDAGARSAGDVEQRNDETGAGTPPSAAPPLPFAESYQPRTVRSDLKSRGRYAFAEAVEISLALTTAIEHLHKHGLIHRDIKPANVIFVNGRPKLADIGLVTETGATMSFVGTEGYLPPEGPGSVQADIFSLGKTLYEIATGKDRLEFPELPTQTESAEDEAGLFELNEVLLKACHADRQRRYRTAAEMHADLVLLQAGKSVRRSRAIEQRLALLTRVSLAGMALTVLLVAGYFYQQIQTREARRLALDNRQLAVKEAGERQRAEGLLNTLQSKQAEHFFENDDANKGVAYLARLLRQNPTNHIVASRLMSALMDRSFAAPVWSSEPFDFHTGADFHPNGRLLVTWGRSGSNHIALLMDVTTGQDVGQPMLHEKPIRRARFSPDGRLLATMSADGHARIWDGVTGALRSDPLPPPDSVWRGLHQVSEHLAFSPDGGLLVTSGFRQARVWKVATGEILTSPLDHGATMWDVEFSPDGRLVATSGETKTRLFDAATGDLRHILDIADGDSECLARFSPDGRRIVTIGGFHVRVWDVQSGERLLALDRDGNVHTATFSPDGIRLATADSVRSVQIFEIGNGRLLLPPILHGDAVSEVSFDAAGERILTWEPRRARVWDSRTGRPLTEWMSPMEDIHKAQFSPGGTHVLITSKSRITLWDARPGQALNLALRHARTLVPSARFSGDGTRVVSAAGGYYPIWSQGGSGEAIVWDARTGAQVGKTIVAKMGIQSAEFSPDDRRMVTACWQGQVRVWDAHTGAAVSDVMQTSEGSLNSARFSPDGKRIVTAADNGIARIWDAASGQPLTAVLQHSNAVVYAEFSPDGLAILTVPRFHAARIWDARSGQPTGSFGQSLDTARFSPDGQRVVTGETDGTGQVWDRRTGRPVGLPLKHRDRIYSVRFSRDGRFVVTASRDQSARIWDAVTGSPVAEPLQHKGAVLDAEFSPDGQRVATASEDYTARVWDVRTGQPLTEPLREGHFVGDVEFSPDGTRLVVATASGLARIWDLTPARLPVPAWLPDLADAIAGATWTDQEVLEPVPASEYLARRAQLLKVSAADDAGRWLRWLLAERGERTVSYVSAAIVNDYLDGLLRQEPLPPLRDALHLAPDHPLGAARLASRLVGSEYGEMTKHPQRQQQADFLSARAVKLAPTNSEVWRIRSEVLDKAGRRGEALTAIEHALSLARNEPESWLANGRLLAGAGRNEEALQAYNTAVHLASTDSPNESDRGKAQADGLLKDTLLARAAFHKRLGREEQAAGDAARARGFPPRDPDATPELVDLGSHYNARLEDNWQGYGDGHNLASLPRGIHVLAGMRWELRGLIQVGEGLGYPSSVPGIAINAACRRVHFLHAAIHAAGLQGKRIGHYLAHFADGRKEEIPLVVGRDLDDWFSQPDDAGKPFEIAWTGTNATSAAQGRTIRLFKMTWDNPAPQVPLLSLDLVSEGKLTAPFAVAVTVDSVAASR